MRFAYADPPYVGQARKHYGPDAREVNHHLLIAHLLTFDGWALSLSSTSLIHLVRLRWTDGSFVLPDSTRVGAWIKPFGSFKKGVDPAYVWEPVLFRSERQWSKDQPTVRDWVSANITLRRGTSGAKPDVFCFWLFDLLGWTPPTTSLTCFPGAMP